MAPALRGGLVEGLLLLTSYELDVELLVASESDRRATFGRFSTRWERIFEAFFGDVHDIVRTRIQAGQAVVSVSVGRCSPSDSVGAASCGGGERRHERPFDRHEPRGCTLGNNADEGVNVAGRHDLDVENRVDRLRRQRQGSRLRRVSILADRDRAGESTQLDRWKAVVAQSVRGTDVAEDFHSCASEWGQPRRTHRSDGS